MIISIITATFNSSCTISDCISSIAAQSYPHIEHIIVDGGSTDGTVEIIKQYGNRIAKWISERDNGIYDAMNKGIAMATGDIIGILNSDDFYAHPDALAKVAAVFYDRSIDACYGDLVYINSIDSKKVVRHWRSEIYTTRSFYWGWMPPHPTFFVRKSVYEKYGVFNLELGSAADYELMLRFLLKYKVIASYITEVLVKMRTGGVSNTSMKNRLRANQLDRKAWDVNGLKPYPWTLICKPVRKIRQWFERP